MVSEYFNQARSGEVVLTVDERPITYTQTNTPDAAGYAAFLADLATRVIRVDDNNNNQNDPIGGPENNEPYFYPTDGLSTSKFFRGGDTITDLTGVMHWSFVGFGNNAWRIRPIQDGRDYTFESVLPRAAEPTDVGGSLRVASFNVLNYFPTPDTGANVCGPAGNQGCRGADSAAEFVRQQDKIVSALAAIDADVVGLIEIENSAGAVQNLVDALNAEVGLGTMPRSTRERSAPTRSRWA